MARRGGGGGTSGGCGGGTVTAYPQLRSWLFTSTLVNFAASPVTTTSQSSGASNQASTAVFDASNNLLFYDNISSASIFSATNQSIDRLNAIVNPNRAENELDWSYTSKEMVVAPVPGKPYFYYLFYTLSGNYSSIVAYAIIDYSCGQPPLLGKT